MLDPWALASPSTGTAPGPNSPGTGRRRLRTRDRITGSRRSGTVPVCRFGAGRGKLPVGPGPAGSSGADQAMGPLRGDREPLPGGVVDVDVVTRLGQDVLLEAAAAVEPLAFPGGGPGRRRARLPGAEPGVVLTHHVQHRSQDAVGLPHHGREGAAVVAGEGLFRRLVEFDDLRVDGLLAVEHVALAGPGGEVAAVEAGEPAAFLGGRVEVGPELAEEHRVELVLEPGDDHPVDLVGMAVAHAVGDDRAEPCPTTTTLSKATPNRPPARRR